MPDAVVVPPAAEHKATVIWLHGLGDQGESWAAYFRSELRNDHIKVICPSADNMRVALAGGAALPAWFNILGLDPSSPEDIEGIKNATKMVHALVDKEIAETGIPSEKMVLGGFSMGGALAINAGFRYPKKLGGIISLSGFLLRRTELPGTYNANRDTPYFLAHGTADMVVPYVFGDLTQQTLSKFCSRVSFHPYNGIGHSCDMHELRDVKNFLSTLTR